MMRNILFVACMLSQLNYASQSDSNAVESNGLRKRGTHLLKASYYVLESSALPIIAAGAAGNGFQALRHVGSPKAFLGNDQASLVLGYSCYIALHATANRCISNCEKISEECDQAFPTVAHYSCTTPSKESKPAQTKSLSSPRMSRSSKKGFKEE